MGTEKDKRIMDRLVWVEHKDGSGHLQRADYVEPVKPEPPRPTRVQRIKEAACVARDFVRLLVTRERR